MGCFEVRPDADRDADVSIETSAATLRNHWGPTFRDKPVHWRLWRRTYAEFTQEVPNDIDWIVDFDQLVQIIHRKRTLVRARMAWSTWPGLLLLEERP